MLGINSTILPCLTSVLPGDTSDSLNYSVNIIIGCFTFVSSYYMYKMHRQSFPCYCFHAYIDIGMNPSYWFQVETLAWNAYYCFQIET